MLFDNSRCMHLKGWNTSCQKALFIGFFSFKILGTATYFTDTPIMNVRSQAVTLGGRSLIAEALQFSDPFVELEGLKAFTACCGNYITVNRQFCLHKPFLHKTCKAVYVIINNLDCNMVFTVFDYYRKRFIYHIFPLFVYIKTYKNKFCVFTCFF